MFVIKFTDKTSGFWAFQVKDIYQNLGQVDLFDEDSCYKTKEDAEQHIGRGVGKWHMIYSRDQKTEVLVSFRAC